MIKVGRNDPCICGSGLKFKKCCFRLVEDRTPFGTPEIATYLHFEDLWPREARKPDVIAVVSGFAVGDLLQCLAKLNVVLQDHYTIPDRALELAVLHDFLSELLYKKVVLWFNHGNRKTALFRTQVLATIRLALTNGTTNHATHTVGHDLKLLGETLLKIGPLIDRDQEISNLRASDPSGAARSFPALAYRYLFYNHSANFGTSIGRFWAMMTAGVRAVEEKHPRQSWDVHSEFERAFGFPLLQMLGQGLGILTHYSKTYEDFVSAGQPFSIGEQYFEHVKSQDVLDTAHLIFRYLSLSLEEHIHRMKSTGSPDDFSHLDLFSIYDHPLVEVRPNVYIPLDLEFLRQRITDGTYWALFNNLKTDSRDHDLDQLRSSFGLVFEWYVAELLRHTYSHGISLWLDWDGDFPRVQNVSVPDAVVREGDTLFFLEVTASALPPSDAISCDPQRIEDGLAKIWFGKGEGRKSAKILQLQSAIESFEGGRLTIPGVEAEQIRTKIPILVNLRYLPILEPLIAWYRDLIRRNGIFQKFTDDLVFMDIEELELLASIRAHGTDWRSVFQDKSTSKFKFTSFNNFLIFTKRSPPRHPWLGQSLKNAFSEISQLLFDREFIPPE